LSTTETKQVYYMSWPSLQFESLLVVYVYYVSHPSYSLKVSLGCICIFYPIMVIR